MADQQKRIIAVDAMRGFAIAAILLLHSINHFLYPVYPQDGAWAEMDQWIRDIFFFLFEGKMYAIFALLFGFTFALQMANAKRRGQGFRIRFYWRMLLLIGFGVLHAAFFPGGDPLVFYALTALALPLVCGFSDKWLLLLALFMLAQPLEWLAHFYPQWKSSHLHTGEMYQQLLPAVSSGNFWEMIYSNASLGIAACLTWALEFGRFSQTLGLFLIGTLLHRRQYFTQPQHTIWKRGLVLSTVLCVLLWGIKTLLGSDILSANKQLAMILGMWQNLAAAGIWTILLLRLFNSGIFSGVTNTCALYGKMSLSNFIGQAIMASYLLFPYGLDMADKWGESASLLMAFGILTLQIQLSKIWLKRYKRGPLESLWHRLTWIDSGKGLKNVPNKH